MKKKIEYRIRFDFLLLLLLNFVKVQSDWKMCRLNRCDSIQEAYENNERNVKVLSTYIPETKKFKIF